MRKASFSLMLALLLVMVPSVVFALTVNVATVAQGGSGAPLDSKNQTINGSHGYSSSDSTSSRGGNGNTYVDVNPGLTKIFATAFQPAPDAAAANASGTLRETVSFVDPSLTGTRGTATISFDFLGSVSTDSPLGFAGASLTVSLAGYNSGTLQTNTQGANQNGTHSGTINFVWGQPYIFQWISTVNVNATPPTGGTALSTADYANTIRWLGVTDVMDANGNPVTDTDFSITSESGFDYRYPASIVVPVPPTLVLLLSGVAVMGLCRRFRFRA